MHDVPPQGDSLETEPLLRAMAITKRYGTFLAKTHRPRPDLHRAEIHALLGENGAGKSTLVKAIYGLIQPNSGELRWMGRKVVLAGPSDARALRIGMVFQHFSLFDNLTVAENVVLGLAPTETFAALSQRLAETSRVYGLPLDPKREVWRLSVGELQRIEIVRALMQDPKLLILDEPTAVLTTQEADQLFVVLDRLKAEGRAILYISHKLDEVKRLCDTATILRGGKKVATCDPRRDNRRARAHDGRRRHRRSEGGVRARRGRVPRVIYRLFARAGRSARYALDDVSLEVRGGEIVGIAESPGTARMNCLPRCPESGFAQRGRRRHRRPVGRRTGRHRAPLGVGRSYRRNGSATAPCRA